MCTNPIRLLASLCLACIAHATVQTIPVPGQAWEFVIDAPNLGERKDSCEKGEYQLSGRAGDLVFSVFVELPAKRGGNKECREFYWAKGSRNPALKKDSVKISSHERYERVEYLLAHPQAPGGMEMRNVNYFFAHAGRWIDVHISCRAGLETTNELIAAFDRGFSYRAMQQTAGDPVGPGLSERVIALPKRNALVFAAPVGWRSVVAWPKNDVPPTLKFSPAKGDDFNFKVTPMYRTDGKPDRPTDKDVQEMSSATMAKVQTAATEHLKLVEWKGANASGLYYFATDKAPKSGEYPYMLQGVARLDELLVTYTVLMRRNTPEAIAAMLAVLQTMHRHPRSDAN